MPDGMRLPRTLVPGLVLALVVVAGLADRALVGQADAARAAALARIDEDARQAAQATRAALAPIEQALAAGRPAEGVVFERMRVPPGRRVAAAGFPAYARRSRAELAELLVSTAASPNGLPEAVVARLALGPAAPLSGVAATALVEERLLDGELPVDPDDLPYLCERLGKAFDPRLPRLIARLRAAPDTARMAVAPAFARRLDEGGRVEGWSRTGDGWLLHYSVVAEDLLRRSGVTSVAVSVHPVGSAGTGTRTIPVPDVDGLELRVEPRTAGALRLAALRVVLWLSALAGVAGLVVLRRGLGREEKALARERAFLSGVTHELRTPLTTIRVLGETLAEGRGDPREYGRLAAQESQRLEALVERVLTLARVEHRARFGVVEPAELLQSVVTLVRPRAERRGARVWCRVDGELPRCRWDGDAVRRALLNLLDNAVTHGREGGVVTAAASATAEAVRLSVADDGPGIRRTERRRIFGRFERGTTDAPGTGLGLYLVEEVARVHGGRVDLATEEGRGSTFTLVLPVSPPGSAARDEA
jgi:signal transduction histidine kinase